MTATASTDVAASDDDSRERPRWVELLTGPLGRVLLAAASGVLLQLSFPPRTLWFLAPLAFAGLGVVLYGRRARAGFGYGLVFALAFFLLHLMWIEDFLGADFGSAPWLALSALQALFAALACAGMTAVGRLPAPPVWMAALWVGSETLRSNVPLNGFPWGRTAFSQPSGAFTSLASIGGAPLVSFAVALCGFGAAWAGLAAVRDLSSRVGGSSRPTNPPVARTKLTPTLACAVVPVVVGLAVWPTVGVDATDGEMTVAVVQGNAPNIGLDLLSARDEIRANHVRTTAELLDDIEHDRVERPDLLVWPETATAVGDRDKKMDALVQRFGVPALIGALYLRPDGLSENAVFEWNPETGRGEHYAKQELVPFAEYVPWRPIARWFTPFLDNTTDMRWGDKPGVLDVGGVPVGVEICYEAAYDYVARETVDEGAELLVVPTNNAWYGPGEMTYQQLAMSRLRAVEHGRSVVVAATSGVSGIVRPDGSIVESSGLFTSDVLVGRLPLRSSTTVATVVGAWPERVIVAGGALALVLSVGWRIRNRRRAAA